MLINGISHFKIDDAVLLRNTSMIKGATVYDPCPYKIVKITGNQATISRGNQLLKRNVSVFKHFIPNSSEKSISTIPNQNSKSKSAEIVILVPDSIQNDEQDNFGLEFLFDEDQYEHPWSQNDLEDRRDNPKEPTDGFDTETEDEELVAKPASGECTVRKSSRTKKQPERLNYQPDLNRKAYRKKTVRKPESRGRHSI